MVRYSSHACYKSPIHKLVRFFEQSRNNWKEKYKAIKITNKRLENKVRFLEKSRDSWKQETIKLRKTFKYQRQEKQQSDETLFKKNKNN